MWRTSLWDLCCRPKCADLNKMVDHDWSETGVPSADRRHGSEALLGGSLRTARRCGERERVLHWSASLWTPARSYLRHAPFLHNKTFFLTQMIFFFLLIPLMATRKILDFTAIRKIQRLLLVCLSMLGFFPPAPVGKAHRPFLFPLCEWKAILELFLCCLHLVLTCRRGCFMSACSRIPSS